MGMQGPLTAMALGRSPYDDVVEGEGDQDPRHPVQYYDYSGRPINPETRRMNRDIVRSHNEVMLVVGVAEAEIPFSASEAESQRRHEAYEESAGIGLASSAKRCVEAVGLFGVTGLRQRILIYNRYSRIPFWEHFRAAKKDFSVSRDIVAGAPIGFLTTLTGRFVCSLMARNGYTVLTRRLVHGFWTYVRVHLEIYVALQRLGLTSSRLLPPSPKFFIPFTEESPMPAPTALDDFTLPSLLRWLGGAFVSTTPFLVWFMAQRLWRDWKPQIWNRIFKRLPSTMFQSKKIPPPPPPTLPPSPPLSSSPLPESSNENFESGALQQGSPEADAQHRSGTSPQVPGSSSNSRPGPAGAGRRPSLFSARGDEYASDEDDHEGVSATLISFDVEATESTDAPPGLWSAELRPSLAPDSRANANQPPVYLDTLLTRLPALIGAHIFTDAIVRILIAPYEATALRLVARTWRLRQGLLCQDLYRANMLSGLSWTSVVNFFGAELLHLVLCGEVWGGFMVASQIYHMTEEQWKEATKA